MHGYRFLVDNDCRGAIAWLARGRALSLEDVGLPENALDEQIIEEAVTRRCIILTANGFEFVDKVNRYVGRSTKKEYGCRDASGLVIVPNVRASKERLIARAEERLRLGDRRVAWPDVWEESLLVRLKRDEHHEVQRLPRCPTCLRNESRR